MSGIDTVVDPVGAVAAWRAQGAATADPVAFGVIEALARRAATLEGEARGMLVQRVEALMARHAVPGAEAGAAPGEPAMGRSALAALTALVDRLGRSAATPVRSATPAARQAEVPLSRTAPLRPLKAVTAFKGTWSRLRAEHRLRQALAHVPALAGPLNSSHVVNRALQAMHDLSPEYLDAFMSHVDTLQWLEQASGAGDLAPRAAAPGDGKRRPAAKTTRKA